MSSHRPKVLILIAVLALTACAPTAEPPSSLELAPRLALEPCSFEGADEEFRCGVLSVAENRAEPDGRRIDLNVVVAPAVGEDPAPDPIFFFEGGPGGAAAEDSAEVAGFLGVSMRRRSWLPSRIRSVATRSPST